VALSLRATLHAFLLREQREDDDGNEPNHVCFPFRRRFALSSAAAPCVLVEQLCVFACGITIEDATRTPMWFYTSTLRRMNARKELVIRKGSRKTIEQSWDLRFLRFRLKRPRFFSSATPGKTVDKYSPRIRELSASSLHFVDLNLGRSYT
jgi:hypothetical protein